MFKIGWEFEFMYMAKNHKDLWEEFWICDHYDIEEFFWRWKEACDKNQKGFFYGKKNLYYIAFWFDFFCFQFDIV